LNEYLKQIRPFILIHRLQKIKAEVDIKEAIRIVKSISVILCADLKCNLDGETIEAEKYDFVPSNQDKYTYLIKYSINSSIDALKKDSDLSDVISEIYSIVFDVTNIRTEIRNIFRNDAKDTQHQIIDDFGEESLLNVKSKFEISIEEFEFWKLIYKLKEIPEKLPVIEDESKFRTSIANEFNLDLKLISQIDYEYLSWKHNLNNLREIFINLKISLLDFNNSTGKPLSFYDYHEARLSPIIENIEQNFINHLWHRYANESTETKSRFIGNVNSFRFEIIKAIARESEFLIDINYSQKTEEWVEEKFNFALNESLEKRNAFIEKLEENRKALFLTDDQINSLSDDLRSLLYFNIGIHEFAKIKEKAELLINDRTNDNIPNAQHSNGVKSSIGAKEIVERLPTENKNVVHKPRVKARYYSHVNYGVTNGAIDEQTRIELGKKSEEEVLKALKNIYAEENVVWLSSYSNSPEKGDDWGYDMKYRVDNQSEWQFVEVKSFYNGSFYLTKTEFEVAQENPDRYYLYLVEPNGISNVLFIKLLDENNELDYNNGFFSIEIKDYKFTRT
jgi:hypothetical protein